MKKLSASLLLGVLLAGAASCGNDGSGSASINKEDTTLTGTDGTATQPAAIKEEPVSYTAGGVTMNGYITYDSARQGRRPIVLILPEWWGLTDYPRMRARMLAEMGYLAVAVDMYGNGKLANTPQEAGKASEAFYNDLPMAKERIDAALAKAASYPQADTTKTVAIGYCFGGFLALNYAKMGAPVKGVVSFHGDLRGVPPQKGTQAQFLVCHGGADDFVPQPQVDAFRKSMDSAGLNYTFKVYDNATHAFTNPNATEKGIEVNLPIRYNGAADTASWNDMKAFFNRIL